MILYLDTSALVKLYVTESASDEVRAAVAHARMIATATITYAEARAAFSRRHREGALSGAALRQVVAALDEDWDTYVRLDVDDRLARKAGHLAGRRTLRGFDAVHLAAALHLGDLVGAPPGFGCYDDRLLAAALAEGLAAPMA